MTYLKKGWNKNMLTLNKQKLKDEVLKAEQGDEEAKAVVVEVLRPRVGDPIPLIYEKLTYYIRLIFISSLKFKDAPFHKKIDMFYAEQIHSYLNYGVPKYKGALIYGYRESAKTSRVKFCDTYMSLYLPQFSDSNKVVSENAGTSQQFNMDIFNMLAFSRIGYYFPETISFDQKRKGKKENQTMSKFTTTNGVTYSSSAARVTSRGNVKVDITEDGEVETKRPKKLIFDDIENENTIKSIAATEQIREVMNSAIDGMDQVVGFYIILGNYLSLRGNINYFITKMKDDPNMFVLDIPIMDRIGDPTWKDKYVRTDKERQELFDQGIIKVSIESLERKSDNFETEFLNNPKRSLVYFDDSLIKYLHKEDFISERSRDEEGFLRIIPVENSGLYIISVDSARGTGGDQSAFTILKRSGIRYEEVANFKSNKLKPEKLAPIIVKYAREYNNAQIIPENNYPGNELIAFLLPIYNNIYFELDKDNEPVYGVNTNLKSKPEMFFIAKKILEDKLLEINSQIMYDQFSEYPNNEVLLIKKDRDSSGGHFDLLMSLVIGLYKAGAVSAVDNGAVDNRLNKMVDDIFSNIDNYR